MMEAHKGLTAIGGCLLIGALLASCADIANSTILENRLSDLNQFRLTPSEKIQLAAVEDWPDCLRSASLGRAECARWQEKGVQFQLAAINHNGEAFSPVVESHLKGRASSEKVIIHLTGGTDLSPYSRFRDPRSPAFGFFHSRQFMIASIGYWGTNFRTNLQRDEIELAARDLENTYMYYSSECGCEPLVIAESLGAAVLFKYLSDGRAFTNNILTIAPVMGGIDEAVNVYRDTLGAAKQNFPRKTTRVYRTGSDGIDEFVQKLLVPSVGHLEAFGADHSSEAPKQLIEQRCPTFVLGSQDPLNRNFTDWALPSVRTIDRAGHDLFAEHTPELIEVFDEFLSCRENGQ